MILTKAGEKRVLNTIAIGMTAGLILVTILISIMTRTSNATTADFYLAGRKVSYFTNASAICGDYFSAASFLGVAAAVYASGLDGVWFGTGFGAAFVPVVVFFASPIRRFGEYTIPDFLAARFQSSAARIVGVIAVQMIAIFYLAPQMVGAGNTWKLLVGHGFFGMDAYTTGVVATVVIMAIYVALGGMKGTTWNQMIQFWVLFTAMALVVVLAFAYGFSYSKALGDITQKPLTAPAKMTVEKLLAKDAQTGKSPAGAAQSVMDKQYWDEKIAPKLSDPKAEVVVLLPQTSKLTGKTMTFTEPGHRYNWLDQFSMVLALVLGTAGLPHILNRYYTNPSGKVARFTTVGVLALVALFYVMAAVAGAAGRALLPEVVAKATDPQLLNQMVNGVLTTPDTIMPFMGQALAGEFGLGYVAAGAFAAMFSTIGGLLMASAASWGHDLYEQYINPHAPEWKKVAVGKGAVIMMAIFSLLVGIGIPASGLTKAYPALIALMVTWAFAVSGGAFVPVLFASIWWKKITLKGALAGMIIGGGGSIMFIIFNILRVTGAVPKDSFIYWAGQLTFPTIFTVPAAALAIYVVSVMDQRNLPTNLNEIWIRIHGTAKERQERRLEALARQRAAASVSGD